MSASTARKNHDEDMTARFILFVTGESPRSRRARNHLARALQDYPNLQKKFETVDVLLTPAKLLEYGVFATPALMYQPGNGEPNFLYGDLSDPEKLRALLCYDD